MSYHRNVRCNMCNSQISIWIKSLESMKSKPVLIAAFLLLLSSCAPSTKVIQEVDSFIYIDFSKYSESGFYILPSLPTSKYKPISLFEYTFIPAAMFINQSIPNPVFDSDNPDRFSQYVETEMWVQDSLDVNVCMDSVVSRCQAIGANAIYDFKLESYEREIKGIVFPPTIRGIKIYGLAAIQEIDY